MILDQIENWCGPACLHPGLEAGFRFIVETFDGLDLTEWSALYVPAGRFGQRWSVLGLIGARFSSGSDAVHDDEVLFNATLFYDVDRRTTVGLEANLADEIGDGHDLLLMPQVHFEITERWMIQGGVGAELGRGRDDATAAFRIIWAR